VAWTSDDGRKDGTRCVVAGEPGLAHAGAVVADQRRNLVVAHFHWLMMLTVSDLTRRPIPLVVDVHVRRPAAAPTLIYRASRSLAAVGPCHTRCIRCCWRSQVPDAAGCRIWRIVGQIGSASRPGRRDAGSPPPRCARNMLLLLLLLLMLAYTLPRR